MIKEDVQMKKIKFALKMKDGVEVRSLEELREAFDLGLVMGYLADGRLERWLEDRFYEEEAGQVVGLDKEAPDLVKRLCTILQVPYTEEMEMDAVIAKLLEDDRALQELAVGFSASVSSRGSGSVQQIDGEGARLVLDDIESVLTDASAQARFQEHVFQWMRENLEGVNRNPSKYLMDELCRRLALMVRDSLSELLEKNCATDTEGVAPNQQTATTDIDVSDVDISNIDLEQDRDIEDALDEFGELGFRRILKQLRTDPWFSELSDWNKISDVCRYYCWLNAGRPDLNRTATI